MLKKEEDIPESDDEDDLRISDKEFVLVSCSVEKIDQCGFETYIYDHDEATTYLHHDTIVSFWRWNERLYDIHFIHTPHKR